MRFSPAAWLFSWVKELIAFFTLSCMVDSYNLGATFDEDYKGRKMMSDVPFSTVVTM